MILPTAMPKPPFALRPSTPPGAPLRKRLAPNDDITEVDAPSAKRVKTEGAVVGVGSPSKRKRLKEEG